MPEKWTALPLLNGWNPIEGYPTPAYRIENENDETVVVLRGTAEGGNKEEPVFRLPEEARPDPGDYHDRTPSSHTHWRVDDDGYFFIVEQRFNG